MISADRRCFLTASIRILGRGRLALSASSANGSHPGVRPHASHTRQTPAREDASVGLLDSMNNDFTGLDSSRKAACSNRRCGDEQASSPRTTRSLRCFYARQHPCSVRLQVTSLPALKLSLPYRSSFNSTCVLTSASLRLRRLHYFQPVDTTACRTAAVTVILAHLGLLHSQVDYLEVNLRRTSHVPAANGRVLAWHPGQSTYDSAATARVKCLY